MKLINSTEMTYKLNQPSTILRIICIAFVFIAFVKQSALAQGPVQPEAMQFEPVDVTDVVNLATGDFVYTIPLMSVPGPEGDYPVVLSYHSGIGPNQPATWVGLGWTLNPGAINRTISGYPDDYKGDIVKTHFEAQSKSGYGLQLGMGLGPVGINMSYDSYSGNLGVNAMVSIFSRGDKTKSLSVTLSYGTSGFSANGSFTRTMGMGSGRISAGTNGVGLGGGVSKQNIYGEPVTKNKLDKGGTLSLASVDASLTNAGSGASFSIAGSGFSTNSSSSNGNYSQKSGNIRIPLPNSAWISLGYSKWKWSLNETYTESSYGILHQAQNTNSGGLKNEHQTTAQQLLASKDAYNVAAQGIGGSFSPVLDYAYVLEDGLENDEKGKLSRTWQSNTFGSNAHIPSDPIQFRFLDDQGLNFTDKSNLNYGEVYNQFDSDDIGGKKITPLISEQTGKIQGYTIVATDGIIYEFMQPVNNLFQYSESKFDSAQEHFSNWNTLNTSFATSWLITSIKGPDYIDRDNDNNLSNGDWGYWIKFEYDRIQSPQIWRAPYTGYAQGIDSYNHNYSLGVREVFYLSSIETETHKAIFTAGDSKNGKNANVDLTEFPDNRIDPKSRGDLSGTNPTLVFEGDFEWVQDNAESISGNQKILSVRDYVRPTSGELPSDESEDCYGSNLRYYDETEVNFSFDPATGLTTVSGIPSAAICSGFTYYESEGSIPSLFFIDQNANTHKKLEKIELFNKVDLSEEISKVEFGYDYHLRPNSSGSSSTLIVDGVVEGVMALNDVSFFGQNDVLVSPPYRFGYANGDAPGAGFNPSYDKEGYDFWGSYKDLPQYSTGFIDRNTSQKKGEADLAAVWALTNITTPTGAEVEVEYESDDFFYVNNTFFLSDAVATLINTGSSSGVNIEVADVSDLIMEKYSSGIIMEEHSVTTYYNDNELFPDGEDDRVFSQSIGFFEIEDVDELNDIITLNSEPTFRTTTAFNESYSYYFVALPKRTFGGGSRVKEVSTRDGINTNRTLYVYKNGEASSGSTASLPADREEVKVPSAAGINLTMRDEFESVFMDHESSYGRPSPGVIYSKVQVLNVDKYGNPLSGMTEYEFLSSKDFPYKPYYADNHFYINDVSGTYGKPKSVTYYEQYTESSVVKFRPVKRTETLYDYSSTLDDVAEIYLEGGSVNSDPTKKLGITQQKYISRIEKANGGYYEKRIEHIYQNVYGVGQVEAEYYYDSETSGTPSSSILNKVKSIGYDAYSGAPIVTVKQSSVDDEVILQKITPAWWKYQGLKDKNMLSQVFQETTFLANIDIDNLSGLLSYSYPASDVLSSNVTTWSNNWSGFPNSIWRKNDTYSFITDYSYQDFPSNSLNNASDSYPSVTSLFPWKMTSNVVSYDGYGHALETVNADGTYQAVLYDENNSLVKAVVSNAKLSEIKYVDYEGTGYKGNNARTGEYYGSAIDPVVATAPSNSPIHGGGYKAGIWYNTHNNTPLNINGITFPGTEADEWKFALIKLANNQSIVTSSAENFDDITIIPEYASISYFSYDPLTWRVEAMTGPDHRTSFYEYDDTGRLKSVRDQNKKLIQNNSYGFGNSFYIDTNDKYYNPEDLVEFNLTQLDTSAEISGSFLWNFGDGEGFETTSLEASHRYANSGSYTVSVSYKDGLNKTLRAVRTFKIGTPLTAEIVIVNQNNYGESNRGDLQIEEPDGTGFKYVMIQALANASGGVPPLTYSWSKCSSTNDCSNSNNWVLLDDTGNDITVGERTSLTNTGEVFELKVVIEDFDENVVEVQKTISNIE